MTESFRLAKTAAIKTRANAAYGKKASPVEVITVDPLTMVYAEIAAGGDMSRIQIIDSTSVMVWNSPEHKRMMNRKQ